MTELPVGSGELAARGREKSADSGYRMVLEIGADAWQVPDNVNAMFGQIGAGPDASAL